MLAALRALDRALAEPKETRRGLHRQMLAAFAAIAERGPGGAASPSYTLIESPSTESGRRKWHV